MQATAALDSLSIGGGRKSETGSATPLRPRNEEKERLVPAQGLRRTRDFGGAALTGRPCIESKRGGATLMARVHFQLDAASEPCGYLPGREAATDYRFLSEVSPEELEALLERGWRRFGAAYFRPVCPACQKCVSLRLPVAEFQPNKSQRRALRRCEGLRVVIRRPVADAERFELYLAWHQMREETRGWKASCEDIQAYGETFCVPNPCAWEIDYYDGERLVGVGLVDKTPGALSSVYFFYHPDWRGRSIGTASVLFEIAWAKECGLSHVYLGFCILECLSTAYKAAFRPHEILEGRPGLAQPPVWQRKIHC
jgi:arginyl-tRNA--protein-N-Asp/Glu arginylyltransferase